MIFSLASIKISKRIFLIPLVTCLFLVLMWISSLLGIKYLTPAVLIVGIVLSVFATVLVAKSILSPIRKMNNFIEDVTRGDLTKRADISLSDEIGEVAHLFNTSIEHIKRTITHFTNSSNVVSVTAHDLDSSYKEMIAGTNQAVAQVNSVAVAGEEMSSTSSEIARNCLSAARSSDRANQSAVTGQSIVDETLEVMNQIDSIVKVSANIIRSLGERSGEIGGVLSLINDIADQTNLLALNAAIEAARAGEHGRGFAVVADEVRKLAEKTTEATKHIGDTIKAMQSETKNAVISMEEGVKAVEAGTKKAKKSDVALKDILQQINMVGSEIAQIAAASEQQTATTNELANNIQAISALIEQTAGNLNRNAQTISKVADLALDTQRIVTQFKMATTEDARILLEKAVAYLKAHGKEKAFKEFSNPNGEYVGNGLYIIAQDFNGTLLLNGADRSRVGMNLIDSKDPNGVYFVKEMINLAKTKGGGEYVCAHLNFTTKLIQQKVYYVQRIDNYYLSCGVYK